MYKHIRLAALMLLFANSSDLFAQSDQRYSPAVEAKIKQVEDDLVPEVKTQDAKYWTLAERMAYHHIHGLSIAVIHHYKMEWARGYGWADTAEKRMVNERTLFQAASVSKSLNGVGVLKLVQDKRLDLYADINNSLKSWKFPYDSLSKGKKINTANLLSHTAGLTVHGFGGYARGDILPSVTQILDGKTPANSAPVRSMYEPGLKTSYSGGGVTISQIIINDQTGLPYDEYMWKNVLKPFGMTASSYSQPPAANKGKLLATGYKSSGSEIEGKYHIYPEQAAAGLWTNPTDLAKYMIETQLAYNGKAHKVLNRRYTRLQLTPFIDSTTALGVFIIKRDGISYFSHGGANEGFRCLYWGSLEGGNGVVVMVNSDNGAILNEVMTRIAAVYEWNGEGTPAARVRKP